MEKTIILVIFFANQWYLIITTPSNVNNNTIVKFCYYKGIRYFEYSEISKLLKFLFENYMQSGICPDQWEKVKIIQTHEKGDKWLVKTINQLPCSQYVAKYLSGKTFLNICLNTSNKTIFFLSISQVLSRDIVSNNLYLSLTRYINRLILVLLLKCEKSLW